MKTRLFSHSKKSIIITHHIYRIKEESPMITLVDAEKEFGVTQYVK